MKLDMQKKSILKILGENDKNIKLRKIWGVVLVRDTLGHGLGHRGQTYQSIGGLAHVERDERLYLEGLNNGLVTVLEADQRTV